MAAGTALLRSLSTFLSSIVLTTNLEDVGPPGLKGEPTAPVGFACREVVKSVVRDVFGRTLLRQRWDWRV
jgi:hypothetical protein